MPARVSSLQHSLAPLLAPFGGAYAQAMRLRAALYRQGLLASWKPPAFTVSVGNIGWGGTGKTPLVSWLLGWAASRGMRPAVLTRGYRARPKTLPYVVSPQAMAEEAGDEPLMLAREHREASIIVDPVRSRGGRMAAEKLRPNLYILDDGFQHMAVKRDMNLVLLTVEDLGRGWGKVIPAGSWREDERALARADAFLIKAPRQLFLDISAQAASRLGSFGKPVFSFSIRPKGVRRITGAGEWQPDFEHKRYLLFSGVGEPRQVESTVTKFLGYGPEEHRVFPDHHFYTKADVASLELAAGRIGCERILCTPKDAVKLGSMASEKFWSLELDLSFGPSLAPRKGAAQDIRGPGPFPAWWEDRFDALHFRRYGETAPAAKSAEPYNNRDDLGLFGEDGPEGESEGESEQHNGQAKKEDQG